MHCHLYACTVHVHGSHDIQNVHMGSHLAFHMYMHKNNHVHGQASLCTLDMKMNIDRVHGQASTYTLDVNIDIDSLMYLLRNKEGTMYALMHT